MASRRTNLQSLIERLFTETPDRPVDSKQSHGLRWTDEDAISFAIDTKYNVVMMLANTVGQRAFQHTDFDDFFTGGYRDTAYKGKRVVGMDWRRYRGIAVWHKGVFASGENSYPNLMLGRLWTRSKVISFWSNKADVMTEWKLVEDMILNAGGNPKRYVYEFGDSVDLESYDDVVSPKDATVLKEDPDTLGGDESSTERLQKMKALGIDARRIVGAYPNHGDGDATPFLYDIRHKVLMFMTQRNGGEPAVHDDIVSSAYFYVDNPTLFNVDTTPLGITLVPAKTDAWDEVDMVGSDPGAVTYIGTSNQKELDDYLGNEAPLYGAPRREDKGFIHGRMWEKIPAISFWAEKDRVMASGVMDKLDEMVKRMGIDPNKTVYEFLDHDDLMFREEISVAKAADVSDEEMKAKMAKQHLDPQAKRDLAGDEYVAAHATKLAQGHDFAAQANAKKQTSDGVIKLGSLLKEDPDRVTPMAPHYFTNSIPRWKSDGVSEEAINTVMKKGAHFEDENAVAFCFDVAKKFGWYGKGGDFTHGGMMEAIIHLDDQDPYWVGDHVSVTDESGMPAIKVKGKSGLVQFYGKGMTKEAILEYIKSKPHRNENSVEGRTWKGDDIVTFWTGRDRPLKNWEAMAEFIEHITEAGPKKMLYEFADEDSEYFSYFDVTGQPSTGPKKSEEEMELMRQQHLDAIAKKQLTGDEFRDRHMKKHAQGHDYAAQANAKKQTSDNHIKLGSLLTEDPDGTQVKGVDFQWGDDDAQAFFYSPKFNLLFIAGRQVVHSNLLMDIARFKLDLENSFYTTREMIDTYQSHNGKETFAESLSTIKFDPDNKTFKYRGSHEAVQYVGGTEDLLEFLYTDEMDKVEALAKSWSKFRDNTDFLIHGRIWQNVDLELRDEQYVNIMSFWNTQTEVKKLQANGTIGKIIDAFDFPSTDNLYIDFGDNMRDAIPYRQFAGSKKQSMSPEEYKAALEKQHLDPEAKKQLAGDEYEAAHATKLAKGRSFAAKANMDRVGDSVIKLGSLLKEDPENVMINKGGRDVQTGDFTDDDAVSFLFHPKFNFYVQGTEGSSTYHVDILEMLVYIGGEYNTSERDGRQFFMKYCTIDDNEKTIRKSGMMFHYKGTYASLIKLAQFADKESESFDITNVGDRGDVQTLGFLGRAWTSQNILSFWAGVYWKDRMIKSKTLDKIISLTGLSTSKPLYIDFADLEVAIPYSEMIKGKEAVKKDMTPEELRALQQKQHIDPEAKKKLAGADYNDAHMAQLAKGQDFAAKANMNRVGDGHIKLGQLLKEDPEDVQFRKNRDGKLVKTGTNPKTDYYGVTRGASYQDEDGRSFLFNAKFNIFIEGFAEEPYHYKIIDMCGRIGEALERAETENRQFFLKDMELDTEEKTMTLTGRESGGVRYVGSTANLMKYCRYAWKNESGFGLDDSDMDRGDVRLIGYLGRCWKDKNVISFWADVSWKERMVKEGIIDKTIKLVGMKNTEDRPVWIDFANTEYAQTYNEIVGKASDSSTKKNMTPEELKALQQKQHLDPEAKKKLAGDEYSDDHLKQLAKGQDFAAQANMNRVGDGHIKLGNLLTESPDDVEAAEFSPEEIVQLKADGVSDRAIKASSSGKLQFGRRNARPFCVNIKHRVGWWGTDWAEGGATHGDVARPIGLLARGDMDDIVEKDNGYMMLASEMNLFVHLYGPDDKAIESFLADYLKDDRVRRGPRAVEGRTWIGTDIISFWQARPSVLANWEVVEHFLKNDMELQLNQYLFQFGDDDGFYSYARLRGTDDRTKRSEEEMELMKQQHLDATAKKQLAGDEYNDAHMAQLAKGQDFAAKANVGRVGDGHVKLGDLLKETPDIVDLPDGGVVRFADSDAWTFLYRPQDELLFLALTKEGHTRTYHGHMVEVLVQVGSAIQAQEDYVSNISQLNDYWKEKNADASWDEANGVMHIGEFHITIKGNQMDAFKAMKNMREYEDPSLDGNNNVRRNFKTLGITGRYWAESNITAFWLTELETARLLKAGELDSYFDLMGIDIDAALINTMEDTKNLHTVEELKDGDVQTDDGMTKAQKQDMAANAHFDKDHLRGVVPMKHGSDDIEARRKARAVQGDGHIKLGNLLK